MSDQIMAQPELAGVQIDTDSEDISRSEVILKGALAAGAVYGALAVGPFVGRALAMAESGDVGILNFALTLEYLEAAFYEEAQTRVNASGDLKSLIQLVGRDEEEHVGALTETIKKLGGKPVAEPKFDFPYNGAGPMIESKEVLGAAGSIVQVEARHAAAIRLQNKEEPAPEAFDPALTEAKVLKAVEPFIA